MHARAHPGSGALSSAPAVTEISWGGVRRHGKDGGGDHTAGEGRARHDQRAL